MRKALALLVGIVLALVVVVGARTAMLPSRQIDVAPVTPVAVDAAAASARLAAAVRLRTISSPDDPNANADQFRALHAQLQASFPLLHRVLAREVVDNHGLVYTWKGSVAGAAPVALLAHQDVVPIAPNTEGDWSRPPFSGAIDGGYVWGRGTWDDKGNLYAMLEAVELLVASGWQPPQTIHFVFGHDEEVGGQRGAAEVARRFRAQGVRLRFVLDEGLLITQGVLPGLDRPSALVGMAEKGHVTLRLTATATPGHASMPPSVAGQSAIGMLSAALVRLEQQQLPLAIRGLSRDMFEALAPEMRGANRIFLSNLWLFRPLVERQLAKAPGPNATLRTTTALTVLRAGQAENVMPGRAQASVQFRVLPGDTSDSVLAHVRSVIANPAIAIEKVPGFAEPSKVAASGAPGYRLIARTLRELHPDLVVAPGLYIAASDSRHFDGVADEVYKFSPMRATSEDLARFHGTDERIAIANYVELIQFYHQLLKNAGAPP